MPTQLGKLKQDYGFRTGEEYTDEEEKKKIGTLNQLLSQSDQMEKNYMDTYSNMHSLDGKSRLAVAFMFTRAYDLLTQAINRAKSKGRTELAKKWENERDKVEKNLDIDKIDELVDKSEQIGYLKKRLERIMRNKGSLMRQFVNWVFQGTSITTEGGEASNVEGV